MAFGEQGDKRTYGQVVDSAGLFLLGAPNDETINVCEGLADALAISTREYGAVIATITTLRKIKNDRPTLSKLASRDVCIFSDSDKAGIGKSHMVLQHVAAISQGLAIFLKKEENGLWTEVGTVEEATKAYEEYQADLKSQKSNDTDYAEYGINKPDESEENKEVLDDDPF